MGSGKLVGEFAPYEPELYQADELTRGPKRAIEVWMIDRVMNDHVAAVEYFDRWVSGRGRGRGDVQFDHVADVLATDVEGAWEVCQTVDGPWLSGPQVYDVNVIRCRSASTCDVFVDRANKEAWMSTGSGWYKLDMPGW